MHNKPPERAVRWRLRRLVIFPAHEKTGCVHVRDFTPPLGQWLSNLEKFRLLLDFFQRRAVWLV
jgi:hypothetical protein